MCWICMMRYKEVDLYIELELLDVETEEHQVDIYTT